MPLSCIFIVTKNRPEERHYPHTIDADKIDLPITAYGSTANSPRQSHRIRSRCARPSRLNYNKKPPLIRDGFRYDSRIYFFLLFFLPPQPIVAPYYILGCGWGQVRIISCCCPPLVYKLSPTNWGDSPVRLPQF